MLYKSGAVYEVRDRYTNEFISYLRAEEAHDHYPTFASWLLNGVTLWRVGSPGVPPVRGVKPSIPASHVSGKKTSNRRYRTLMRSAELWVVSHEFWLAHRSFLRLFGVEMVPDASRRFKFSESVLRSRSTRDEKKLRAIIDEAIRKGPRQTGAADQVRSADRSIPTTGETLVRVEYGPHGELRYRIEPLDNPAWPSRGYAHIVKPIEPIEPADPPSFMPNAGDRVAVHTSYGWVDEVVTGGPRRIDNEWVSYCGAGQLKASGSGASWRIVTRRKDD